MLERIRRKHPGSRVWEIIAWRWCQQACALFFTLFYRLRASGTRRIPAEGPVLIAANHESFLDPPAIGCRVAHRQIDFVARSGLFANRHFGGLIAFLHSIPVAEEGPDAPAIREIVRRLRMGRCVLIFPEGSRTPDGSMQPFKRGVALLVKRASCPVVPAAIDGAYEAWPRTRKRPKLFGGPPLRVRFGDPIPYAELMADGPDAALARIEREVAALRASLRRGR